MRVVWGFVELDEGSKGVVTISRGIMWGFDEGFEGFEEDIT